MYKIENFDQCVNRLRRLETEVKIILDEISNLKWIHVKQNDINKYFTHEPAHKVKSGIYEIEPSMVKKFNISNNDNYVGNIFMDSYGLCENTVYSKFIQRRKLELQLESKLMEEFGEIPKDPLHAIQQKIDEIHKRTAFDLLY